MFSGQNELNKNKKKFIDLFGSLILSDIMPLLVL